MNCGEFQDCQFEYLEGSLPDRVCAEAKEHLNECAACRQSVHDLEGFGRVLSNGFRKETEALEISANLHRKILAAVEKERTAAEAAFSVFGMWKRLLWIGGVALVLVSVVSI